MLRVVQFETSSAGRRVGVVDGQTVRDVTSVQADVRRVLDAFAAAEREGVGLETFLARLAARDTAQTLPYGELLENRSLDRGPVLRPPVDHPDPCRVLISGTGLTHLGGMQARDEMHTAATQPEESKSDSRKMFEMGLAGGKPAPGERGAAPEWFYKGSGVLLRGHGETLAVPPFAPDGGEEPEVVGCYVIDARGVPRRLGLALGIEWSDHVTEKRNYLYLAPSKLRECSVGPELVLGHDFQEVRLRCRVERGGRVIYDSGELLSGEEHMCHSLANIEDHHFKYPQHRLPGDVHLHYFGTSKLSYGHRDWTYQTGDRITLESPAFSAPLVNHVHSASNPHDPPLRAQPA